MPELAEVAYACTVWKKGINQRIASVYTHPKSRVYREENRALYSSEIEGKRIRSAQTHGKQMLFTFSRDVWLGLHLGMTGWLFIEKSEYQPRKHDALVLRQPKQCLVFRDPRQFGRLRIHLEKEPPSWWDKRPPSMLSKDFKYDILSTALLRHQKRPLKALLLDQRYFPGMGNWMADEVLWRSCIHPESRSSQLNDSQKRNLYREVRAVVRGAMKTVGKHGGDPPATWLFHQRWKDGGTCPKSKLPLIRAQVGGRTTCWSPSLQIVGK